jgi:uncharacterized protein YndB with AHSA1/START domain
MASDAAGQPERPRLVIERTYDVPPEAVFQAWTEPQALSRWFGPEETQSVLEVEIDLRVGGRYRIAFVTSDGERHDVGGVYREVEFPRLLSFTWAWRTTPERESLVTIRLEPCDGGTRLVFCHERFFDEVARDNHQRGWTGTFRRLDRFLQGAAAR